jgi:hypothetical protein
MIKKILACLILWLFIFLPTFAQFKIHVDLPERDGNEDLNIQRTRVDWWTDLIAKSFDKTNSYLWWSFLVVSIAMSIYAWYTLITANWDKKATKKASGLFIWTAVWICIAMLSYAFVRLLANLI